MKLKSVHILTVASIASAAISAFAAAPVSSPVTSPIVLSRSDSFVPASFSADGNPMLSFTSFDKTDGTAEVQVLDASIESVASFTVPADPNALYDYKSGAIMQNMHWEKIERNTICNYQEEDIIKEYLSKLDFDVLAKAPFSENGIIWGNKETSFETLPSGEKVLKHFVYQEGKEIVDVTCSGSCKTDVTFDPKYTELYYVSSPLMLMSLLDYDKGTSSIGTVSVTQTLFNNDANFEYVSPLYHAYKEPTFDLSSYKWHDFPYGYLYDFGSYFAWEVGDEKAYNNPDRCIGFSIRNQDGSELQTVIFEKGYIPENDNFMSVIIIGEKKYLSCNLVKDKTSYTVLYEIIKGENSVRQVGAFKTGVHPTLVTRGQNVMVDFENPDNDPISVSVTDLTGKVVYNRSVNSGVERLAIPSESMSDGMNIVTVYDNYQPKSSTKVMVR
ncbi:MAG: T9SS type A sorting domain-containing protein [Muribaculaceae bacterium]|nr:T9SS type A sorting domain-containing protein [Muribaculaceae bacterium]